MAKNRTPKKEATAVAKGGPKTAAGKARASMNATKHGILGAVAPHEADAYADHLAAVRADRQPVGYLEEVLTDRVALALWRLGRVATYEAAGAAKVRRLAWESETTSDQFGRTGKLARIIERHGLGGGHDPGDLMADAVADLRERAADNKRLRSLCEKALDGDDLAGAMDKWSRADRDEVAAEVCSVLDKYDGTPDGAEVAGKGDDWTDAADWTPGEIVAVLTALGSAADKDYADPPRRGLWEVVYELIRDGARANQDAATAAAVAYETVAGAAIPGAGDLDKIAKYEAHLERTLYKALHELEALQDKRQGGAAPLARVEIHGAAS